MASGVAMPWVLKAQKMLKEEFDVLADIYSVTSWNELRRDGLEAERFNLLNSDEDSKVPFVTELLKKHDGPIVAVSDWMKLVPEQLRPYLKQDFYTLGTDGWGVSDTRGALRRHFLVDAESIVIQSLISLVKNGEIKHKVVKEALNRYKWQIHQLQIPEVLREIVRKVHLHVFSGEYGMCSEVFAIIILNHLYEFCFGNILSMKMTN